MNPTIDATLIKSNAPGRCKTYLGKSLTGEWTQSEFDCEIAYWSMENIDEYRYRILPSTPPALKEYNFLPKNEKTREVWKKIYDDETTGIRAYQETCSAIRAINYSNRMWLWHLRHIFCTGNHGGGCIEKIDQMLERWVI